MKNILITRVINICHYYNVETIKLLLDTSYMTSVKYHFFHLTKHDQDGRIDPIRSFLHARTPEQISEKPFNICVSLINLNILMHVTFKMYYF